MRLSVSTASLACGLLLSTPAFAARVHIHTSASSQVTTHENGTVTRSEESRSETYSSGADADVRTGSYRSVSTQRPAASAAVRITGKTVKTEKGTLVLMRLARRVCTKLGSEDKEQCMDDAAEGSVSAVREKLRKWMKRR